MVRRAGRHGVGTTRSCGSPRGAVLLRRISRSDVSMFQCVKEGGPTWRSTCFLFVASWNWTGRDGGLVDVECAPVLVDSDHLSPRRTVRFNYCPAN